MNKYAIKTVLVIFLALCFALAPNFSRAERSNILIDQSIFNLSIDAGKNDLFKFKLKNLSDQKQKIVIRPGDYVIGDENEVTLINDAGREEGMSAWIFILEPEFVIDPDGQKEVSAAVNVPQDAPIGSHQGGVFVEFSTLNEKNGTTGPVVGGRIGAHVLVNVSGTESGTGEILNFSAPKFVAGKADFQVQYKNTGNTHYIPHGEIAVRSLLSGVTKKVALEKHFTFPERKLTYQAQWQNDLSWAGAYSAQSSFVDGNGNIHAQTKYMFGILFFPIAIGLVFLIIIFVRFKKIHGRKK